MLGTWNVKKYLYLYIYIQMWFHHVSPLPISFWSSQLMLQPLHIWSLCWQPILCLSKCYLWLAIFFRKVIVSNNDPPASQHRCAAKLMDFPGKSRYAFWAFHIYINLLNKGCTCMKTRPGKHGTAIIIGLTMSCPTMADFRCPFRSN